MTFQQLADRISPLLTGVGTSVDEAEITLADNTINNASTAAHGFLKKLSNTASDFMNGTGNWAAVTKDNVGLGNVDNTSDTTKPVSQATQTALNLKHGIITPAAHIPNPAGGLIQDNESRAAIVLIIDALETAGVTLPA